MLAYVKTMMGELNRAQINFEGARAIEHQDSGAQEFAIWSRAVFLMSCGRFAAAAVEIQNVICDSTAQFGEQNLHIPRCKIILAELGRLQGDNVSAGRAIADVREWALAREAQQLLCWSALIQARIELPKLDDRLCKEGGARHFAVIEATITQGLKIARDCGYGLYHIDLLLERARLHLLRGDARAALEDSEVALDTGIPANEETGQVELLAANHEECGYAWAIPAGLQLRAEALLLRAAQTLDANRVAGVERSEPPADEASNESGGSLRSTPATPQISADVTELIEQAKQLLHEALDRWHDLRDPEPTEDNNFKLDGKEYNFRAAETWQILHDLDCGTLTRYPLRPVLQQTDDVEDSSMASKPAKVFFSYAHEDEAFKDKLIKHLSILERQAVIETWDDRMIAAGEEWKGEIDSNLEQADVILLLVSSDFLASDYCWDVEMERALERHDAGEARVIPIILRPVDWHGAPFARLQALPKNAQPVTDWGNEDTAFTDVARGIRVSIENP